MQLWHLPETEYREHYDIFADFRFGGYKLLPDIITETRNYNISAYLGSASYMEMYENKIPEGFMEKKPEMVGVSAVRINV